MDILNNRLIKTEMVEWKKLVPFQPDNLKKTEPHKLQKLANSLCQNGFSMNFYVWEKDGQIFIIDGHSRWEVLQLIDSGVILPKVHTDKTNYPYGMEYQVTVPEKLPCSFLHLKNKTEAKKAVLIYNSKYKNIDSDILVEWVSDLNLDELKSQIEIPELKLDFDMPQELENDTIDDIAKIKTNIKLGDLIEIGRHRLLCGDSTKKEDVERLMNGAKADMVFTDPPYGMNLDTDYTGMESKFKGSKGGGKYDKVIGDNEDFHPELITCIFQNYSYVKEIFIFGADYFPELLVEKQNGSWIVWDKRLDESADKMFGSSFELCWSKQKHKREIARIKWAGIFGMGKEDTKKRVHPTQKPVLLVQWFLNKWGEGNDIVSDLFLGSGSTMVACQTLDRTCYGMELDPLYCQVIINRMRKNFPELEIKINGKEYKES